MTTKICFNKQCSKKFTTSDPRTKFCSLSCSSKRPRKKKLVEKHCAICNKTLLLRPSQCKQSKSGLFFCSKSHKDEAQKLSSPFTSMRPSHYKDGRSVHYQEIARRTYPLVCVRCNYQEHIEVLEVDHIDQNRLNNDISNLQILCPTCHRIKHFLPDKF